MAPRVLHGLGLFLLDNLLIGLAATAMAAWIDAVPSLSFLSLGISIAAGFYWLPPLRRAALAGLGRVSPARLPTRAVRVAKDETLRLERA